MTGDGDELSASLADLFGYRGRADTGDSAVDHAGEFVDRYQLADGATLKMVSGTLTVGQNGHDGGNGIVLDTENNVFITGATAS